MSLPFTRDQFLDVFGDYNDATWPIAVTLWLLTAAALVSLSRDGARDKERSVSFLLAVHWLWAALAYHATFFSTINPAAWIFAGLFVVEAGLLAWHGVVRGDLRFTAGSSLRHVISRVFVAYGLMYPALAWVDGLRYPWLPTFGVPCPTTIVTVGFLIVADPPVPRAVMAIPIVWAGIGGSAAFVLGVHADLMLIVAGLVLAIHAAAAFSRGGISNGSGSLGSSRSARIRSAWSRAIRRVCRDPSRHRSCARARAGGIRHDAEDVARHQAEGCSSVRESGRQAGTLVAFSPDMTARRSVFEPDRLGAATTPPSRAA